MRTLLIIISVLSLIALMLPSILFLAGSMGLDTAKWIMLIATVVWFAGASLWMGKEPRAPAGKKATVPGQAVLGKTQA